MDMRDETVPLLVESAVEEAIDASLGHKIWVESKKLWQIAGPTIFCRITIYSMNFITQALAGHLGNLELAAISITYTVVAGLFYGLLLGMASALETLCGQAYGAKKYHLLGIYLQRAWIVLFVVTLLFSPIYMYTAPILELFGQPHDIAKEVGILSVWMLPVHFSFAFQFPLQRFLQSQLRTDVIAYSAAAGFVFHIFICWLLIYRLDLGIIGATCTLNFSWWIVILGQFGFVIWGGCPLTWTGFSIEAFSGLWDFFKLSASSGVMLCLENWYYRILILLTGNLKTAEVVVDALTICMNINAWEMMIPLGFFAATGVRVSIELGAGNGKAAKFATKVSVITSLVIGLIFWSLIIGFHDKIALIFTSSIVIINAVNKLAILLALTILFNSIQPVLSGVAVGSGWQAFVAYINIGCYYLVGLPLGVFLGWISHLGVLGIWAGMIGGTAVQTLILAIITIRCDWDNEAMKASMRMNLLASSNQSQKTLSFNRKGDWICD